MCCGPRQVVSNDDLDRQDLEAPAHEDVGVGVIEDVVRADVARRLEPEPGDLRQHLSFAGDRGQDPVEGAQPVCGNENAPAVRQIVIVADLASVVVRQFRDRRVYQDVAELRRKRLRLDHEAAARV